MNNAITNKLAKILGLPSNTTKATLLLRASEPPLLRVTRIMIINGELENITERFELLNKMQRRESE